MNPGITHQSAPPLAVQREAVNFRSIILGLVGVTFINSLNAFNITVLSNNDLIGGSLPTGLLLFLMLFVILINAPLRRFAPRYAFSSGELAVSLGMILVSCAVAFLGVFRYLPTHLVKIFYYAAQRPEYAALLRKANLSDWLFPSFASSDPAQRGNDPIVQEYAGRALTETDTFIAHFQAVPWHAWLQPTIAWGIFLIALFGSVICMMVILRRQWVENERLQFPLTTVYMSLIETPAPGKALNPLFRNRLFWIAFGLIASIHLFNGLATYFPRYFPPIPLAFDINNILTEEPWRYCEWPFKYQRISFLVIGLTMFMQTRTAFSLWFIFVLLQVVRMAAGMRQSEISEPMQHDQLFGAVIVFGCILLYVARQHLFAVLRQMVGPGRPGDPRGRYLPYRLAGWGFVCCQLLLVVWLVAAGTTIIGALVIAGMLMLFYIILARIVADTGMIYPVLPVPVSHPFDIVATAAPSLPHTSAGSHLLARFFSAVLTHDMRQTLPPYAQHALVVADQAAYSRASNWRKPIHLIGALILALVAAYIIAGGAMLYTEYTYAATLDRSNRSPIDWWVGTGMVTDIVMDPAVQYTTSGVQAVPHNRLLQIGIGAGVTAVLGALRLSVAGWPLHPVGYLLVYTYGIEITWFSIFLGWLAKTTIVHFGGARLYSRAQPFFLGVIYGEVITTGFWLVTNLALYFMGIEYRVVG